MVVLRPKTIFVYAAGFVIVIQGTDLTSRDPEMGQISLLFHPRKDKWADHFRLNGAHIEALTPIGRVTMELLQFNKPQRIKEREILIALNRYP